MTQAPSEHPLPEPPVSPGTQTYPTLEYTQHIEKFATARPPRRPAPQAPPLHTSNPGRNIFPISESETAEMSIRASPRSPVKVNPPELNIRGPESATVDRAGSFVNAPLPALPIRTVTPQNGPTARLKSDDFTHSRASSMSIRVEDEHGSEVFSEDEAPVGQSGLPYHAFDDGRKSKVQLRDQTSHTTMKSFSSNSSGGDNLRPSQQLHVPTPRAHRSTPSMSAAAAEGPRGRALSPLSENGSDPASSASHSREHSRLRRSPANNNQRPVSYLDLLNDVPYHQQVAPGPPSNHADLKSVVGTAASLLDTRKTLEMYRANVKKTNDATIQYEFAIFMINTARDAIPGDGLDPQELVVEAKHILQRLADRSYPFAQYYLGDGYFSGLFNKDKPDYDKAFPLFISASKHGHAESSYRAALCYEFGWGTTKSYPKAVNYFRTAASKNHPGAATRLGLACLRGDMGLGRDKHREGLKWLKRAAESADFQYNAAPYELGLLHLHGFGDDVFKDEAYAAQLFTQSAELNHVQANFMMGEAYENGLYQCPKDAALSIHFYNGAATLGHVQAMMALCAWYMVGAEPVLKKDEAEAYAWARQAAEHGLPKAEYTVGYFTEMGIGCRRDPLEANVWYVRAAEKGSETARQRLAIIRAAASGVDDPAAAGIPMTKAEARSRDLAAGGGGVTKDKKKFMGLF